MLPIASALLLALAQDTPATERPFALMVGDRAPAIQVAEWVQGAPIQTFTPGQVYVVEFWATWCGPCKVAIPHLNELSHQYAGKATFLGVSVWETINADEPYSVPAFVKGMGDKMTYTVAADVTAPGIESGPMAQTWMQAAGLGGIPTAFVVDRTGRIAWIGHPMSLEKPLGEVVAGTFDVDAAARKYAKDVRLKGITQVLGREISSAKRAGDWTGALTKLDEALKTEPGLEEIFGLERYFLLLENQRVADATTYGRHLVADVLAGNAMALDGLAWQIVDPQGKWKQGDYTLAVSAAERASELLGGNDASTLDTLGLALFKAGDVARAIEVQEKAVALAGADPELASMAKELAARLAEFKAARKSL